MKLVGVVISFVLLVTFCGDALADVGRGRVFDVREYGAKSDGKSLDTAAIQKAFDACGKAGGGTVLLPPGTYLSGPLIIRTKTMLLIESGATLRATDEPADYKRNDEPDKCNPFLSGEDLEDVTIAGRGVIDGAGARWWAPAEAARQKKIHYPLHRPNLIELTRVKNLVIRDVTLQNSPKFHLVPVECEGVTVSGITILAPEHSPNTDGIDPSMCRRVTISGCTIDCGDDNIAIKSGKKLKGREFACEDIVVTDCTFKHGHGMSIGSETVGGVRHVRVKNCTFEDTGNGIRIKSNRTRGGCVKDIVYEDIRMRDVRGAISISCYYPNLPLKYARECVTKTTPRYSGIIIRNLDATSTQGAGIIAGLPESRIECVMLENVSIKAEKTGLEVRNARRITLKDSKIESGSGRPFIYGNCDVVRLMRTNNGEAGRNRGL
jgi:polygalacturonase